MLFFSNNVAGGSFCSLHFLIREEKSLLKKYIATYLHVNSVKEVNVGGLGVISG